MPISRWASAQHRVATSMAPASESLLASGGNVQLKISLTPDALYAKHWSLVDMKYSNVSMAE